jgi:triphosphoribosyl-dephospho-CoA synthase
MHWSDFMAAATAIGIALDTKVQATLGEAVLACTQSMLDTVKVNTSLGTILLLVPLAQLDPFSHWTRFQAQEHLRQLLERTTPQDAAAIYDSIRLVQPGGLGTSPSRDIRDAPPASILEAMQIASEWDDVAWQYVHGYEHVFALAGQIDAACHAGWNLGDAVRKTQAEFLATRPDSLVVRKHGPEIGRLVMARAQGVIASGPYASPEYEAAWAAWDDWLRDPKLRKNPGTTADLIAAALYVRQTSWR